MLLRILVIFILLALSSRSSADAESSGIATIGYVIQMGAFAEVKNAEKFTKKLQSKGIEAFYFRKDNGFYAVRFGDFQSKEKARAAADRLVADRLIVSYYIAPPNEVVFKRPLERTSQKSDAANIQMPRVSIPPVVPVEVQGNPQQTTSRDEKDMGSIAARTAERFVGIPYRWGGNTVVDGMDCSGFVRAVYNLCGLSIPRTSRDQFKAGGAVDKDALQDGDLIFFGSSRENINHVGIYVGSGRFVHAPRRGEDIRVTSVDDSYFEKRFIGARRYFQ